MKRLPLIDGLRGVAVLGVIWHHLFGMDAGWHAVSIGPFVIFPFTLFSNGYQAVTLFFILSGFVLALPYTEGRRQMKSWGDVKTFYRRRALRLLPLYFFMITFSALFLVKPDVLSITAMLTFTFNFFPAYFYPAYNWVLWTLGLEVWFSVLFPLIIIACARFGTLRVLATATLLSIVTRIIGSALPGVAAPDVIMNSVPAFLFAFIAGMFLAELHVKQAWVASGAECVTGAGCLLASFMMSDLYRLDSLAAAAVPLPPVMSVAGMFLCISFLMSHGRNALTRFFSLPPLRWIGKMSYSFYVWHAALIMLLDPLQSWQHVMMYAFLLPLVSFLSYHLIEQHTILKRIRQVFGRQDLSPAEA